MDVPRTAPGVPFFAQKQLQKSLERILYLWGIRWQSAPQISCTVGQNRARSGIILLPLCLVAVEAMSMEHSCVIRAISGCAALWLCG